MKTLEQQIAELTAEYNFKAEVETLFGGYKYLAFRSVTKEYDNCVVIDLRDTRRYELKDLAKHIKYILMTFKPTGENYTIDFAGKEPIKTASRFAFRIDNGVNQNNHVGISYNSNRVGVQIELPIEFYSPLIVRNFTRGITDCEDHYFTGCSRKELQSIRLQAKELNIFQTVNWYGSHRTHYVTQPEYVEHFEFVILNGAEPNLLEQHNEYLTTK